MEQKQRSHILSFTVPADLKAILDIIPETGYYDSTSEFLRDCIRSFCKGNKGMAALIAFHLYKSKRISIGKAAVLTGLSLEETKEVLQSLEA
jgi:Arc/MetJ-type ribon-helix-helix transcriptional regulator